MSVALWKAHARRLALPCGWERMFHFLLRGIAGAEAFESICNQESRFPGVGRYFC